MTGHNPKLMYKRRRVEQRRSSSEYLATLGATRVRQVLCGSVVDAGGTQGRARMRTR
jgi:hypothetical protein